jgi:hypothetical protein
MAATSSFVLYLSGSGNFDSFTQALMSFLFRHLTNSFKNGVFEKYKLCNLRYLQMQVKAKGANFSKKERI